MTDRQMENQGNDIEWPTHEQLKSFFSERGRPKPVAATFARVISENTSDLVTILGHGLTEQELDGLLELMGVTPKETKAFTARIEKLFSPEP